MSLLAYLALVMSGKPEHGLLAMQKSLYLYDSNSLKDELSVNLWLLTAIIVVYALTLTNDFDLSKETAATAKDFCIKPQTDLRKILKGEINFVEAISAEVIMNKKVTANKDLAIRLLKEARMSASKTTSLLADLQLARLYFSGGLTLEAIKTLENSELLDPPANSTAFYKPSEEQVYLKSLSDEAQALYVDACKKR